jgi:DNA-binding transcriptional ArsR family regulator
MKAHKRMKKIADLARLDREAAFLQALAHPVRLQILHFLGDKEKCGCEIEPYINLDQSTISRHLQLMKRVGVLSSRKDGVRVLFKVNDPRVMKIRQQVSELVTSRVQKDLGLLAIGARAK